MHNSELSEQEQIRRNSLEEIKKLGYNPYPPESYEITHKSSEVISLFEQAVEKTRDEIRSTSGKLSDQLGPEELALFDAYRRFGQYEN